LEKGSKDSKKRLALAAISLLLLSVLILEASTASVARGSEGYAFFASPATGTKGSKSNLVGTGLPPNTEFQLLFGTIELGTCTSSAQGTVTVPFTVPPVSPGNYPISAKDLSGITYAATSFTVVTNQPTASPTSSVSSAPSSGAPQQTQHPPTSTNPSSYVYPITTLPPYSYSPITPKPAESGISPLMIGIIVVAIVAVIIPLTFFARRRGGPEPKYEGASEVPTVSGPTYPPRTPTAPTASRYGQTQTYGQYPSRSTMASRPGMPSRYGQQSAVSTRVCPRCRQTIRADYSICPHCNKRLR
jgi:hypothetical protein